MIRPVRLRLGRAAALGVPASLRLRLRLGRAAATLAVLASLLGAAGCTGTTRVPDADRARLERELPGRTFYLRHAVYVGPFWGDRHKVLLSDGYPGDRPYVADPQGKDIPPGAPTGIVPAGTAVRVVRLELPTGLEVTTRSPLSPRYFPWLVLDVDGLTREPSPTLLLREGLDSHGEVLEEVERYLSPQDLEPTLRQLPADVAEAIREKRLAPGMPADAVTMAWGYPERKRLETTAEGRKEEWVWPRGKRRALLLDGRLVEFNDEHAQP